jgi:hypothetical protein
MNHKDRLATRQIVKRVAATVERRGWSVGFFEQLRDSDPAAGDEFHQSMKVVAARRKSKRGSIVRHRFLTS